MSLSILLTVIVTPLGPINSLFLVIYICDFLTQSQVSVHKHQTLATNVFSSLVRIRRKRFRIDTEIRCVGAHPPFWPLEPARVKPN